jgi:ubiquinone/menaquinone biosynthesis C-methylase UbiE
MRRDDYTEANRQAWNEAAPVHAEQKLEGLLQKFAQPGYSCLDPIETGILTRLGVTGKSVAQPCCNNSRELLSVKNMGAGRCVGFDISEAFIAQARRLAAAGGIDCTFVVADAYGIPDAYHGEFDLATVTIGTLGWMPEISGFFAAAARLLRPGGDLFVYEMHPLLDMFQPEDKNPLALRHSYFRTEPFVDTDGVDYWSRKAYESKPLYWFHHKMSDVIGACLAAGCAVDSFTEYDHDISAVFRHLERETIRPPLCYALTAHRVA